MSPHGPELTTLADYLRPDLGAELRRIVSADSRAYQVVMLEDLAQRATDLAAERQRALQVRDRQLDELRARTKRAVDQITALMMTGPPDPGTLCVTHPRRRAASHRRSAAMSDCNPGIAGTPLGRIQTAERLDLRPKPPAFYRLRLWWHTLTMNDHKAASLRWAMNNATDPQECLCGKRGTVALEMDGFRGDVAPIHWACDEHADVPLTVPWQNGRPLWKQSRDECSSWGSSTVTGIVHQCGCGEHVGMTSVEVEAERFGQLEQQGWVTECVRTASCEPGDHTYTWPCNLAEQRTRLGQGS